MWATTSAKVTAEWQCTQCDTTNRKLLPRGTTTAEDRCMHCGRTHQVTRGESPVRWNARAL